MAPWDIILPPSGLADITSLPLHTQFKILAFTDRLRDDPGLVDPTLRTHIGPWNHRVGRWTVRLWVDADAREIHILRVVR